MTSIIPSQFTSVYLSGCLEGVLYGIYSGIFIKYLQHNASKERTDKAKNSILYAICVLYFLSTGVIVCDIATTVVDPGFPNIVGGTVIYPLYIFSSVLFGCCDFIAQSILIYRCWIVWHQNIRVVIIPSILAIAYLAIWIAGITGLFIEQDQILTTGWGNILNITGLAISMTVNALVTGLIVFKIFKVFREVKATSDKVILGVIRGTKLRSIIFMIIESGMALFSIQLARVVITNFLEQPSVYDAFLFIAAIHQMLNGITPTTILVRVSMGLSFYDEISLVEAAESVLHFAADDPSPNPETGSISQDGNLRIAPEHLNPVPGMGSINQEGGDDDEVGGGDHIRMVDR